MAAIGKQNMRIILAVLTHSFATFAGHLPATAVIAIGGGIRLICYLTKSVILF